MEGLDLKQMSTMVKVICEEKNLPEDIVLDIIQTAIAAAWRKDHGDREMNVRAVLNTQTGDADIYVTKEVVEDGVAYNTATEIPQAEAGGKEIGDTVEERLPVEGFGRVASMTAKQVVMQRLREAEREAMLVLYEDKIGTVVTGVVARVEPRIVRIDLGKAVGIMPRSEQIDGEYYQVGSRIKVYIKGAERDERGAQLVLSRGCVEFIEYLFRQEVPEIENGTVEIKAIAREAGRRTKIAVASKVPGVDPVGTFVGGRGVRVQAVMNEIGDREKIDIINWSDNASEYIREALSPAEVMKVEVEGKQAKVYVTEDQQSIAIGRQGQNVRLASKLTGYELDIELAKAPEKKKRGNIEDSLLSAVEETGAEETDAPSEDNSEEISTDEASEPSEKISDENSTSNTDELSSDNSDETGTDNLSSVSDNANADGASSADDDAATDVDNNVDNNSIPAENNTSDTSDSINTTAEEPSVEEDHAD